MTLDSSSTYSHVAWLILHRGPESQRRFGKQSKAFVGQHRSVNIETLAESVHSCYIGDALQERFRSYAETEETHLQSQLEIIKYHIDDKDTLTLITENGRIDRRHLDILEWHEKISFIPTN